MVREILVKEFLGTFRGIAAMFLVSTIFIGDQIPAGQLLNLCRAVMLTGSIEEEYRDFCFPWPAAGLCHCHCKDLRMCLNEIPGACTAIGRTGKVDS